MPEPRTAADMARDVADVLERRGLPYAIGGAIALGFYATPRATIDVDVNVFVSPAADLERALSALGEAGFVADDPPQVLADQASAEGQFRGRVAGLRVDVFVPAIPYYAELEGRRRQVALLGRPLWILSAEDLVVLKMMFFRRKDLADVEAVLREQGALLDRRFVRQKLVDLSGELDGGTKVVGISTSRARGSARSGHRPRHERRPVGRAAQRRCLYIRRPCTTR